MKQNEIQARANELIKYIEESYKESHDMAVKIMQAAQEAQNEHCNTMRKNQENN